MKVKQILSIIESKHPNLIATKVSDIVLNSRGALMVYYKANDKNKPLEVTKTHTILI